jgi:hypothetical protein
LRKSASSWSVTRIGWNVSAVTSYTISSSNNKTTSNVWHFWIMVFSGVLHNGNWGNWLLRKISKILPQDSISISQRLENLISTISSCVSCSENYCLNLDTRTDSRKSYALCLLCFQFIHLFAHYYYYYYYYYACYYTS